MRGEVWRIDPASNLYKRYYGMGRALDARPDPTAGKNIWFTTANSALLTRINVGAVPVNMTTWTLPARTPAYSLYGIAFDPANRVWITEGGEQTGQRLYRFDPNDNGRLCSYTLPGTGNHSVYVLYQDGILWLGDREQSYIVRFDPSNVSQEVTYWTVGSLANPAEPRGLALDAGGSLWWADQARARCAGSRPARIPLPISPSRSAPRPT